jgi:hypothetical protein
MNPEPAKNARKLFHFGHLGDTAFIPIGRCLLIRDYAVT